MKKFLLIPIVILLSLTGYAQLNNSWIDYNKTYYKFKLAKDTLTRINQGVLVAAGLGSVPAENFQLWRNGKEVRMFTSVPTGILGTNDYLEFWGLMNDGKPDRDLYRLPESQMCDKFSLETDTASYFLTVNPSAVNLRYTSAINNTAGNSLPTEAYFLNRIEVNYHNVINRGAASVLGTTYVYSAAYDIGEGWMSGDIAPCCPLSKTITGLNYYASAPPNSITYTYAAVGGALNPRDVVCRISNVIVSQRTMPFFNYIKDTIRNLPNSLITNPAAVNISISNTS